MSAELNRHANSEVQVEVSSSSTADSRDDGFVNLTVRDELSGVVLVATEIPAGRWWRLMQGGVQKHPAFISTTLDRVGKRMENISVKLGTGIRDKAQAEEVWKTTPTPPGWVRGAYDTEEFRRTNQGYIVILRRWVDA